MKTDDFCKTVFTDPEPLMTPASAADWLGVTPKALQRYRTTGEGPRFVRVSRKIIRYRKSDLERFVESKMATNTILS